VIRPFDNPVNTAVVSARVMAISTDRFFLQAAGGSIYRPWAPVSDGLPVPPGDRVEVYLDAAGAVNGWREPATGLAVNQRRLANDGSPVIRADLACRGPCGVVWLAPAADRLMQNGERCLTCAGPLAPR
jgi:hypothetical protein